MSFDGNKIKIVVHLILTDRVMMTFFGVVVASGVNVFSFFQWFEYLQQPFGDVTSCRFHTFL